MFTFNDYLHLSKEEQEKLKHEFTNDLCILNLSTDNILLKYDITYAIFRRLKKEFNIKRDKIKENELRSKSIKEKMPKTMEKIKQTKLEKYGDPYYHNIEQMKQTNLKRYGVENVFANEDVKKKKIQTYIEHYGVEHPMKNKEFVKKMVEIKKQKDYNYNNPIKAIQTKIKLYGDPGYHNIEKMYETNLKKYGVKNACENKEIANKIKNKWASKPPEEIKNIVNKRKDTCIKKYGVDNPWKSKEIQEKIKNTIFERYGVTTAWLVNNDKVSISKTNLAFAQLLNINNIDCDFEFPLEDRKFDIKVGNILIEINPTYTHNSTTPPIFAHDNKLREPLNKNYHKNKTELAYKYNYQCIHVWDWDDWNKIINILLPKQKIGARKCKIKEVSKSECNEFLNMYHLQCTCNNQQVRLGLYYNDKLEQIMTFGKPRYNKKYEWELLRLCSHKDYQIIGGSNRLWNHFLKTYNPSNIISYCDNSKFTGRVYETLGMELIGVSSPNKVWSKDSEKITNNLLNQRGFDQLFKTNYGKGSSNRELMIENGWLEVYDCGQKVFEWNNK